MKTQNKNWKILWAKKAICSLSPTKPLAKNSFFEWLYILPRCHISKCRTGQDWNPSNKREMAWNVVLLQSCSCCLSMVLFITKREKEEGSRRERKYTSFHVHCNLMFLWYLIVLGSFSICIQVNWTHWKYSFTLNISAHEDSLWSTRWFFLVSMTWDYIAWLWK